VRLGLIFADTAGVMADLGNMLGEDAGDEDVEEDFDDVDAEPVTEEQTA
jgi:hypothetical protein